MAKRKKDFTDFEYQCMRNNSISLEEEFSIIKEIHKSVCKTKNNTELDTFFDDIYLTKYNDIWENVPYIIHEKCGEYLRNGKY